ncbi:YraN family protein [Candidatus Curtissbacteria bacterium]|nr:YraN family protein [Candidatus Curtissbacteria bacterium]
MKNIGKHGEDLAVEFLKRRGYKIIDRNFRIRGGEIDIVALEKSTLVFIEVKTRTSLAYGYPQEAITKSKIFFLVRAAKFYRNANSYKKLPLLERIDVVAIDHTQDPPKIDLIKNATG